MKILKLIKFEFYKFYKKKYPLVIIGVCIIAMIAPVYLQYRNLSKNENFISGVKGTNQAFNKFSGELTEEKYYMIKELMNEDSDDNETKIDTGYLNSVYNQMEYILSHHDKSVNIVNSSLRNINEQEARGEQKNQYEIRYNNIIYRLYNVERSFLITNPQGWMPLFNIYDHYLFRLSFFIAIIVVAAVLFSVEYEGGTDKIIMSSESGKFKLLYAKLITVFLSLLILSVMYMIVPLLFFSRIFDLSGYMSAIQILPNFSDSPYNISLAGFYLLKTFLLSFVGLLLALATGLFCTVLKNIILGSATSVLAASAFYFTNNIIGGLYNTPHGITDYNYYNLYELNMVFNPLALSDNNWFFRNLRVFNIGGYPLQSLMINLGVVALLCIATLILTVSLYPGRFFMRSKNVKT